MTIRPSAAIRAAAISGLIVLAVGCGPSAPSRSSTTGSQPGNAVTSADVSIATGNPAPTALAESSASEVDSTPAPEGTGAESPQQGHGGGPTISVASLPLGGDVEVDGARQCGSVSLIVHNELPKGVSVSIDSIGLSESGIFVLGGDLCAPDFSPCTTAWTWTAQTAGKECSVAVTQITDSEQSVSLVLAGTVHCPDQNACEDVRRGFEGNDPNTRLEFTASLGVVPGSSPSESSSPTAAESSSSLSGSPSDSGSGPAGSPETSAATEASTSGS
jgi:hypothetical protein